MAVEVSAARLNPEEVLELLPQQEPFRFIDEILEVDEDHIVAATAFVRTPTSTEGTFQVTRSRPV